MSRKQQAIYRMALLSEIDLVGRQLRQRKRAGSLYFGAGAPRLLWQMILRTIIDRLKQYFIITGGIGVELHPADHYRRREPG